MANKITAKRFRERTPKEIEEDDERHVKKMEELDAMVTAQQEKAVRMERINPRDAEFPDLTVEEVEQIEKELPKRVTKKSITEALKKKGLDVKIKERRKEREERERPRREDMEAQIIEILKDEADK
jgi:hypothetical protein